jgi:cell division protein FtsN
MIQEHIHKLLFEHDCVIIPDFGGLITHYEPARIHPVRHAFLPPSKRVAFNEKLKLNDGLLISTFAYDKKITAEEAQHQVGAFVRQLQEELQVTQRFELRGIGLFRLNAEQKIEFEYIASRNFLNDSFGLPELITRPVVSADATAGLRTLLQEQQADRAVSTAKPSLRRKIRKIYDTAAVLAIGGLSCSALYFISLQTDYNLSSLNPFSLVGQFHKQEGKTKLPVATEPIFTVEAPAAVAPAAQPGPADVAPVTSRVDLKASDPAPLNEAKKTEPAATAVVKPAVKAAGKEEPEAAAKEVVVPVKAPVVKAKVLPAAPAKKSSVATINSATHRYYIIAGGYSSLKNARWGLKQLTGPGTTGKVILPASNGELHRVSVSDFSSKEEALQNLPELKKKFGNNIWILNY